MNARGKRVDKTFLSLDNAEQRGFIHRDYIAHCFRWTHACKMIQARWRKAVILDVGCGKEMPLPKLIYSSKMRPKHYVGLDVDEHDLPEMLQRVTFPCDRLVGDIAEASCAGDLGFKQKPNIMTCFEMLEHVEWEHAERCLTQMRQIAAGDCLLMVSTPCWNQRDCADNHVNEMTYQAFGALLESTGWKIQDVFGTFASQRDYGPAMTEFQKEIWGKLRAYYDSNVLSVIFAPMFPQESRNCIWDCTPGDGKPKMFTKLKDIPKPWGSSEV